KGNPPPGAAARAAAGLRQPARGARGNRRPGPLCRARGGPPMNEASVYQQLRGQLATLRLAAAAEAPPGVLEAANVEGLGHIALLERLLSIEVEATVARWRASLERFASPPAPWRLSDFDFEAQAAV